MAIKSLSIRIDETMLHKLHVVADYEGRSANNGPRSRQTGPRSAQPAAVRAPKTESGRRSRAAVRDEDPGLVLISRRPPQQKFTNFEEYMNAHGGATAPIEDHSDEV